MAAAFFLGVLYIALPQSAAADAACGSTRFDEQVVIKEVVDGDTLRLSDQRLVRLIGINAPEIGYDGKASEPLAHQAREALQRLVQSSGPQKGRVSVIYGKEKHDRYGRVLAHEYLADGRNSQQLLLEQGLAFWVAVPPNIELLDCYRQAEQIARQLGLGVWGESYFNPKVVTQQGTKGVKFAGGFQRLKGQVQSIHKSRNALWLNLNESVALRIANEDLHNFKLGEMENLQGRTVVVRGWLISRKGRMFMRVQHPTVIELQD